MIVDKAEPQGNHRKPKLKYIQLQIKKFALACVCEEFNLFFFFFFFLKKNIKKK